MEVFFEILKYIIPSVVIFVGMYFILKSFLDSEERKREFKYRTEKTKLLTPIKLQAFERMILFLERINLSNLVMRTYANGMSAKVLQSKMHATIREEYEHNIALQLYIPNRTWKIVRSSKEETVKVINNCADQLNNGASGFELSQFILELVGKVETTPTDIAIDALKNEVVKAF
ncbi:hypothetical protein N8371_02160 [Vicingaceae bacterium]|nr:hypothetical protein [Vicingaceae bacterium]MDC1451208.1 hypothetical protein [Vicingaceae bacterium]